MAGNVWEWVNDWWQSDYYSLSPYSNPPGSATGMYKVVSGLGAGVFALGLGYFHTFALLDGPQVQW